MGLGEVNYSGATGANPFAALAQGLAQGIQSQRELQQGQEDRSYLKWQREQAMADAKRTQAAARAQALGTHLLSHREAAQDPTYIKAVSQAYSDQGLPPPLTREGHVDVSAWQTPFAQESPDVIAKIAQLPKGAVREAALSKYSGVPQSFLNADPYISARDQSLVTRATAYSKSSDVRSRVAEGRMRYQNNLAAAQAAMDFARVGELQAQSAKYTADAQKSAVETQELPQLLAIKQGQLQVARDRVTTMAARGSGGAFAAQKYYAGVLHQTRRAWESAVSQISNLEGKIQTATQNGASEEQLKPLQDQLDMLQAKAGELKQSVDQGDSELESLTSTAVANHLTNATGQPTSTVPPSLGSPVEAAPGIPDGTLGGGGRYIARGGQWYNKR